LAKAIARWLSRYIIIAYSIQQDSVPIEREHNDVASLAA
jgi:hypothetical protein